MQPVELYKFTVTDSGVTTVYRWTSADDSVSWNLQTWAPKKLGRSAPSKGSEVEQGSITIQVARDNPVGLLFRAPPPGQPVELTIYKGDLDDLANTVQEFWIGKVAKAKRGGSVVTLTCAPELAATRRTMPVGRYSASCRWALYSRPCGVDPAGFTETMTVELANEGERQVTVLSTTDLPAGWAKSGSFVLDGERRMIVAQTAGVDNGDGTFSHTLTLSRWLSTITVAASVSVIAGCAHTTGDCRDKFSNIQNFGGFPFLPTRNPFEGLTS